MHFIKVTSAALFATYVAAITPTQVLNKDFPDPSIEYDPKSGNWYTFATAGNGKKLQVAKGPTVVGPWTWQDIDILPNTGPWAVNTGIWAPDVKYLAQSDSFVLYYAALYAANTNFHCVGAATSGSITGPYTAIDTPIACPIDQGGAIDPNGYYDEATNTQWVVYKVDGNAVGNGGSCNNGVEPIHSTPIMMQQVALNGVTKIGDPFQLLDRGYYDGPLIEAPSLVKAHDGTFVLFFSSNCWSSTLYDISYATASSFRGPYTKSSAPLLVTGNYNLTAPGGATSIVNSGQLLFHANCDAGRCMYESGFSVADNLVTLG